MTITDNFCYFCVKTYVVTPHFCLLILEMITVDGYQAILQKVHELAMLKILVILLLMD